LPVVGPVAGEGGSTLYDYEGYRFTLFNRKGGQAPEPGDYEQLHRIGMLLGRMHAIGKRQPFAHRPALTLERFLNQPSQLILAKGFLPKTLTGRYQAVIARLGEQIRATGLESSSFIRTHGDCHPGNILWTRDDGPWLVDFDDCQSAPAVQDMWMLLAGTRHEQELQMAELLDGYNMFHDFNNAELPLIEALRSLRMIHYAGWLTSNGKRSPPLSFLRHLLYPGKGRRLKPWRRRVMAVCRYSHGEWPRRRQVSMTLASRAK
jgi:Ser/Thr protein kinase RdoA (MazF antagonist)